MRLVQGAPGRGAIAPMTDAISAADRGYNAKETISFINETLGATGPGTHKRSLDFPYVFGDGPGAKRHKGMPVSEKGCRAIYQAWKRLAGGSGRPTEAAVYKESASWRVAAMYHNNERMVSTGRFTLIPRSSFRDGLDATKLEQLQTIYERLNQARTPRDMTCTARDPHRVRRKEDQVFLRVRQQTLLQSGDPGWFLARRLLSCPGRRIGLNGYDSRNIGLNGYDSRNTDDPRSSQERGGRR